MSYNALTATYKAKWHVYISSENGSLNKVISGETVILEIALSMLLHLHNTVVLPLFPFYCHYKA